MGITLENAFTEDTSKFKVTLKSGTTYEIELLDSCIGTYSFSSTLQQVVKFTDSLGVQ